MLYGTIIADLQQQFQIDAIKYTITMALITAINDGYLPNSDSSSQFIFHLFVFVAIGLEYNVL